MGKNAGSCLLEQRKYLPKISEERKLNQSQKLYPTWKKLRDEGKCDVISVRPIVTKEKHIKEAVSSENHHRIFTQNYCPESWKDVIFLRNLSDDKRLNLSQIPKSSFHMNNRVKEDNQKVHTWVKMLHSRTPLYTRKNLCLDKDLAERHREAHLNHVQYQTRRDIFNQLDTVNSLRASGKLEVCLDYTLHVQLSSLKIRFSETS